jgi:hypothetical protein
MDKEENEKKNLSCPLIDSSFFATQFLQQKFQFSTEKQSPGGSRSQGNCDPQIGPGLCD